MIHKEKREMCLRCPHSKYYSEMQTERMHCEIEDKYIVFDCHDNWKIYKTLHTVASLVAILDDMNFRQFNDHHRSRLVTCNGRVGLTAEDAIRAINILEIKNK